ncbi:MAG: hypothetical protein M1114_02975, partial [Candidatus Dependentiae bacterium]|nr:hypothetical protein [Candidatus Dependentiae bacterium]
MNKKLLGTLAILLKFGLFSMNQQDYSSPSRQLGRTKAAQRQPTQPQDASRIIREVEADLAYKKALGMEKDVIVYLEQLLSEANQLHHAIFSFVNKRNYKEAEAALNKWERRAREISRVWNILWTNSPATLMNDDRVYPIEKEAHLLEIELDFLRPSLESAKKN